MPQILAMLAGILVYVASTIHDIFYTCDAERLRRLGRSVQGCEPFTMADAVVTTMVLGPLFLAWFAFWLFVTAVPCIFIGLILRRRRQG